MVRSTVRVVVRMRPTDRLAANLSVLDDQKTVTVQQSRRGGLGADGSAAATDSHGYKLDQVFSDASQESIYDACASDIVKAVVAGYNGTVMAYGQTGAGKTYTMMGGTDYRTRGVLPRCIKAVFDEVQQQVDKQFEVRISFVEVYNDRICDLLAPNSDAEISIQEDSKGAIVLKGATHTPCGNEQEALGCLFTGNSNRAVAEHSLNSASSRSHCIYTVHVTSRSRVESESASLVGKMHIVDLAGSERLSKTESGGSLLREAQYINKSLTFLEQVVMALGTANRHVPFRQSKLTNILKDSLGGNSKTTMIANIWPEERHIEETVSTLKFASRMMRVQTEASVNTLLDPETHIRQLQRKIADLKAELQMQNQLAGKSHIAYEGDVGEDERFEMEKTVKAYVTGKQPEVEVRSLREVKEYFRIFKAFVDSRDVEGRGGDDPRSANGGTNGGANGSNAVGGGAAGTSPTGARGGRNSQPEAGVGTVDQSAGQSVGVAAPAKTIREVVRGPNAGGGNNAGANASVAGSPPRGGANAADDESEYYHSPASVHHHAANGMTQSGGGVAGAPPPNRSVAFAQYKAGEGTKLSVALKEHQEQLLAKRKLAADLSIRVNEAKAVIDVTSQQLDQRRMDRQARGEDEVVDNEEFEVVRTVKAKKAEYRQLYDELVTAKTGRDHLVRLVDHGKQQLLSAFDTWYERTFSGSNGNAATSSPQMRRRPQQQMAADDDDEQLDEGERFEMLELTRVMDEDPDSVAYYQARKQTTQASGGKAGSAAGPSGAVRRGRRR